MAELHEHTGLWNCSELTKCECGEADLRTTYKKNSSRGEAICSRQQQMGEQ